MKDKCSEVCGQASFALQRSLPTVKVCVGCSVCLFLVVVVAQCLVKFTWVYLWDSSSAVSWLQGKICYPVEVQRCHLLDSEGQNGLWLRRVRLLVLPSSHGASCEPSVQVGISNMWCTIYCEAGGIRGHAKPTQSCCGTKDLLVMHLLLCVDFFWPSQGCVFLQMMILSNVGS